MAIYSLNHKPIGKSTQAKPFTAAAHVRYITRRSAMSRLDGGRIPAKAGDAIAFLNAAETCDRKNARVIDKLMLALPRELNAEQRAELVRGFAEAITAGRAGWLAAFHDKGKDAENPHCHLVVRDRDAVTGKRVFGTSEAGSTERLRVLWEAHANRALEQAACRERIDHRTLEAQGIKREPTIHEGVRVRRLVAQGRRVISLPIELKNSAKAWSFSRRVDYRKIDGGRTRPAFNQAVRARDTERAQWAAVDADRLKRELTSQARIHIAELRNSERQHGVNILQLANNDGREARTHREYPGVGRARSVVHQKIQSDNHKECGSNNSVPTIVAGSRNGREADVPRGMPDGASKQQAENACRTPQVGRDVGNRGRISTQSELTRREVMSEPSSVDLDRYFRLKEEIKRLYQMRTEYQGKQFWHQNAMELQEANDKLVIVKNMIDEKEVELALLERHLPPPTIPSVVDDWMLSSNPPSEKFDREKWLERQKETREKARKLGRSFEPE